jgi:small subunit ribosomal protein S16
MVTIRLSRGGSKKRPFYHVLVTDSRSPRDSRYIERVGYYNPMASKGEIPLSIQMERVQHWISKGAQPSERVAHLIGRLQKAQAQTQTQAPA